MMGKIENSGFELLEESRVEEISSGAKIYRHTKSGARLLLLLNDDDNKVFCTSFKTPPEDDTGVAHIMEHSVLCGSEKYPVKEPFVELMKGSLNTFLNAMTYPDKTMYPVASRNTADFKNLVDVYMDAVFFPELSRDAFEQEGWHYEVEDDGLSYKGVVFNEMKGVFSSPESFLDLSLNKELFNESTYRYESGGYPPAIPELSYEQYIQFHREKYHPANSWIILYGDLDENYWLNYLDQGYLSRFSLPDFKLAEIIPQPEINKPKEVVCSYPASEDLNGEKSLMCLSFIIGSPVDFELNFAMGVLDAILIGSGGAPLKKALIESQLGKDSLDYGYSNETMQTTWSVGLRDTSEEKKQEFLDLVFGTLEKLSTEGIPEKIVAAAMNSCEFQLREANFGSYPKGLIYSMNVMAGWLYGGDPLEGLRYEKHLKALKDKVAQGNYFEGLIKKVFLDNKNWIIAVCNPDSKMGQRLEASEQKELDGIRKGLGQSDIEELKARNEILLKRQATPDSPEALATIPRVSKNDLQREVERIPTEEKYINGIKCLYHELPSQKISYLHLNFEGRGVSADDFEWLALFNTLLMKCGTKDIPFDEFTQDISIQTGGINSTLNIYSTYKSEQKCGFSLNLQGKAMLDKTEEFCELLRKAIFDIDFRDLERIKNVIDATISRLTNTLQNHGDRIARNTLNATLSATGYLSDRVGNLGYLQFLRKVRAELDENSAEFYSKIITVKEAIFNRECLTVNLAGDNDVFESIVQPLGGVLAALPSKNTFTDFKVSLNKRQNKGLAAPGSVQYVAKGINFKELNYENHGSFDLLNQFLSTGYLWEKVRVQGGAYGCYLSFDKITGALVLVSYRDPNLKETVEVFDQIADYLENLELSDSEFDKLLIGTVGRLDAPMTTPQKSKLALNRYLAGVEYDSLDKRREELLNSTVEDLKKYSVFFRQLAENGKVCVHGSTAVLEDSKEMFDEIISLSD